MGLPAVTSHVGKAQTSTHQAQWSQNLSKKAISNYVSYISGLGNYQKLEKHLVELLEYQVVKLDFINGLTNTVQAQ